MVTRSWRACPIPIAGGEHEFTAVGFGDIIRRQLHHVLQPDACWCGGMTELVKIYRLRMLTACVCPHRGAEPWGLHALAALDPEPLAESGRPWMTWVEGNRRFVTELCRFQIALDSECRLALRHSRCPFTEAAAARKSFLPLFLPSPSSSPPAAAARRGLSRVPGVIESLSSFAFLGSLAIRSFASPTSVARLKSRASGPSMRETTSL